MAGGLANLSSLLEQALGQPERGIVDFKILKEFLLQFLIATKQVGIPESSQNVLEAAEKVVADEKGQPTTAVEKNETDLLRFSNLGHIEVDNFRKQLQSLKDQQDKILARLSKIDNDTSKFPLFDSLPSGAELLAKRRTLIDETDSGERHAVESEAVEDSENGRPGNEKFLNNSWNNVRVNKRLQALEDGVDKLFAMLDILTNEQKRLKGVYENDKDLDREGDVTKLKAELEAIKKSFGKDEKLENEISEIKKRIEDIEKQIKDMADSWGSYGNRIEEIEKMMKDMNAVHSHDGIGIDGVELNELKKRLHELEAAENPKDNTTNELMRRLDDLKKNMEQLMPRNEMEEYVKWPALEEALNVRGYAPRQDLGTVVQGVNIVEKSSDNDDRGGEGENEVKENVADGYSDQSMKINEDLKQEEIGTGDVENSVEGITIGKEAKDSDSNQVSELSNDNLSVKNETERYPSAEMRECLRRISRMASMCDDIESKVNDILADKSNEGEPRFKKEIQDLKEKLASTTETAECNKSLIDTARADLNRLLMNEHNFALKSDTENSLNAIKELLVDLDEREGRTSLGLANLSSNMYKELKGKQQLIDALYECVEQLQRNKADIGNASSIFDLEAYKKALDTKVSLNDFDEMMLALQKNIEDVLQRLDRYADEEESLKEALEKMNENMQDKLDATAEESLKKYLESRIAQLQKSRENLVSKAGEKIITNAAGFRRPLSTLFHCISCDRPVNLDGSVNAPGDSWRNRKKRGGYALHSTEQSKSNDVTSNDSQDKRDRKQRNFDMWRDPFAVTRPCGGNHTAFSHNPKKHIKTNAFNIRPEPVQLSRSFIEERKRENTIVDLLLGSDGQVYRGRYKMTDLRYSQKFQDLHNDRRHLRSRSAEVRRPENSVMEHPNSAGNFSNPVTRRPSPRSLPPLEKAYSMTTPAASFRIRNGEEQEPNNNKMPEK